MFNTAKITIVWLKGLTLSTLLVLALSTAHAPLLGTVKTVGDTVIAGDEIITDATTAWSKHEKIMDLVREEIKLRCSAMEKMTLIKFFSVSQTTRDKLLSIVSQTLDQYLQECGPTNSDATVTINVKDTALVVKAEDYQKLTDLTKADLTTISTTPTPACKDPKLNYLVDELFEQSKCNIIIKMLSLISFDTTGLDREKREELITSRLKDLILINLSENEILELIKFSTSNAFQRIVLHIDKLFNIILTNLSPKLAGIARSIFA